MEYKGTESIEEADVKYHVIRAWGLLIRATIKDSLYNLLVWLKFGITIINNEEVTCSS